jgi:TPR repeat protein
VIKDKGMTYLRNKKFDKAKTLFEKGCKGDAPASCGMLGVMYRDAKGVKRSVSEARRYMGKSCRLGMKSACTGLRRLR